MVTLYSKPGCPGCRMSKRFLDKNGVEFVERDVTEDPEALARVRELGWSQLPVVETPTENWSGYDPDRLERLVGGASA